MSDHTGLVEVALARRYLARTDLRATRERADVSLAELASELGTIGATVARWERGERRPRSRMAVAYASLLRQLEELDQ